MYLAGVKVGLKHVLGAHRVYENVYIYDSGGQRAGLAQGQPLQRCDAAQEPASRAHVASPSDGLRSDRPCVELWGVSLAACAYRANPQQANGRTAGTSAAPSASGSTHGKATSTYARRDARRARKRGGPSAESCVRCPLLFSRTTEFLHIRKNPMIGLHRTFYASSGNCCRESICTFCETELEKEGNSQTTPCISWPARPVVRRLLPMTSCTSPHVGARGVTSGK